jgi:CBS domain-containing protein
MSERGPRERSPGAWKAEDAASSPRNERARPARAVANAPRSIENARMSHKRLSVEDLMTTSVIALKAGDPIAKAVADMNLVDVHHFPVIDGNSRVVGIVSDRDLLRALASGDGQADPVALAMTRDVQTVTPAEDAAKALDQMLGRRISALPVVREDGTLAGIVTTRDFLELASRALHGKPLGRG